MTTTTTTKMNTAIDDPIRRALAPTGVLRASINLGNPILAHWNAATAQAAGVSVDLANALARRLGVALQPVVFDAAGKSVAAVTGEQADVGFFAIDPLRGEGLLFTAPYILIEGSYLVREGSAIQANEQVDAEGVKVMVGKGSAYDLFLSRELAHAGIVRANTSPAVVDEFIAQEADVAAGVRQQLAADAARLPGLRLLPGRFMVIQQAMGVPRSRGLEAANCVRAFVEEMKSTGFVAASMSSHRIEGAQVAPAQEAEAG
ncbi:ABC transporter substrate-binding protein [Variovorax sp. J22G73]|uniref:ABC transporter substrate-binding protein n=1 Tax=unclassified Variovorax TaxID=663243 RepID=UPI0025757F2E|nr:MULTISPECIES: ABC transporter substrate-binding protein [unclassified Variovorax]MDM0010235.1 ABC transporter substrate-binding protein [Variovorax sp. J22R203]MDM0102721.1 ABC transporter substrate-binding protein [Variovorax sp. J22G73]